VKIRLAAQILFGILAWVLFGYYWALVAQRQITGNTIRGLVILALCVSIIWLLTGLWVQHNRRRFAGRPDRRKRRPAPEELPKTDGIGQPIEFVGDEGSLAASPVVEIEVDAETGIKTFRPALVPDEGDAR
jgi:heme A synthase